MEKMTDYFPTAYIDVATNPTEFNKLRKKYNIDVEDVPHSKATTFYFMDEWPIRFVVYIKIENKDEFYYTTLAHEAVHMAWAYMQFIKEDNPSHEFLAHTTQAMMKAIIKCINDKKSKKKEK